MLEISQIPQPVLLDMPLLANAGLHRMYVRLQEVSHMPQPVRFKIPQLVGTGRRDIDVGDSSSINVTNASDAPASASRDTIVG